MAKISPLAPKSHAELPPLAGVRLATAEAGIRYKGRTDLLLMRFDPPAAVAGVFTVSKCPSAPVEWCKANLARGRAAGLVVNSGNANAFTGMKGAAATKASAEAAASALGCAPEDIFLASTGVIGEPLDAEPFRKHLSHLAEEATEGCFRHAAEAIMTTDTFPKLAHRTFETGSGETGSGETGTGTANVQGIAKGAGMIAPDMATMLAFVFTDAAVAPAALQTALEAAVAGSFNAITVDGDTSTSDTVLVFSTGEPGTKGAIAGPQDAGYEAFAAALADVCRELAHLVVKDGEGATKFAEISVTGAESDASAKKIALSIANSPLVKTALAGEDANWGRVVMAVGKAGEPADRDRLAIWFGPYRVAAEGERDPSYSEAAVSAYMKAPELALKVDIGLGTGSATVWTCDLTKEYVAINGDYRS
ncbi:bifunctional glutamate N-acetyltransferase/amino-acid acetyltransferase ArgJ [Afifella sp. IM 167]|uniref:bifunctional glutamate N-acetyltransferase/amino-acid acetyltransferase ArgJ n=1 Tax=Afifella sp. IM 167 TaxID=2033586 RepID=UPI001CCAF02E|nr:bifunctional glutamate N-acetyltransferase/amino-acid acetyltransferase ArgJ [Afifella sp. IM 167]MBZ8133013.1 bifunctional ornithine acetyltransferase/N-acetylglutamate synthase [Afifella sp. IM 167]